MRWVDVSFPGYLSNYAMMGRRGVWLYHFYGYRVFFAWFHCFAGYIHTYVPVYFSVDFIPIYRFRVGCNELYDDHGVQLISHGG